MLMFFAVAACAPVSPTATLVETTPIGSVEIVTAPAIIPPTATQPSYPWTDESSVVSGVCFEAASDMAAMGRRFLLRSGPEHIEFYDAVDSTDLCLRPVERVAFDFSSGRTLAGLWSEGRGCTARHEVLSYSAADGTLNIALRFVTEGDCNYELVRAFWIGFDNGLALNLTVEGG